MTPTPYHQDVQSGLWLPEGWDFQPGYVQLPSGLWVPESAGGGCGWNMGTFTSAAKEVHGTEETEEKFGISPLASTMKAADDMKAKMAQAMMAKIAAFKYPDPPTGEDLQLDAMSPVLFTHPPPSYKATTFATPLMPAMLFSHQVESHIAQESTERAELEVALADFVTSKPARERLAELLWLGTEVCLLNLHRRDQAWRERTYPGKEAARCP